MKPWRVVRDLRKRWEMARFIQRKADEGCALIPVPQWLATEVRQLVWSRRMERASDKWAERTAEVPLAEWRRAMRRLPRQERGGDD